MSVLRGPDGAMNMDGRAALRELELTKLMRERVIAGLSDAVGDIVAPAGVVEATVRVIASRTMVGICSMADVMDCHDSVPPGTLPVEDLCDMHTVIGHRALLKTLRRYPVVAHACGLAANRIPDDPVILAQLVVAGLTRLDERQRRHILALFREEQDEVMTAARFAVRDAVLFVAASSAKQPEIAATMLMEAARLN
jgi:hypothetical protein